jgi:hypothetical protein
LINLNQINILQSIGVLGFWGVVAMVFGMSVEVARAVMAKVAVATVEAMTVVAAASGEMAVDWACTEAAGGDGRGGNRTAAAAASRVAATAEEREAAAGVVAVAGVEEAMAGAETVGV